MFPYVRSRRGALRPFALLMALLPLLAAAAPAHAADPCAPPSFYTAPVIRFPVASSPASITTADFNRDGRADLATTVQLNNGTVAILLGTGDGAFLPPKYVAARNSTFPIFSAIEAVVAGDFNGDGAPDLAVSWNADEISVMLGNGDGTFGAPSRLLGGATGPTSLTAADLNADGKLDLVLTNANSANVSVFMGTGTGTFAAPTHFPTGGQPSSVAVGDFNGDGKIDLAVAGGNVYILLGDGSGGFGAPARFETVYHSARVSVADFNGDGKSDLVVGHYFFNQISVLFGTGSGTFGGRLDITVGTDSRFVSVGDFNRDGKADVVTANREADDVSILLGDGAGHFSAPVAFIAGSGPINIALADFNGDGETDLATANVFGSSVSILIGKGGGAFVAAVGLPGPSTIGSFAAPGDFNGDTKVDFVISDFPGKKIFVQLGDGAGGFGAGVVTPTAGKPFFVTPDDFDRDGKLDLVSVERGEGNAAAVSILLGNGDGTFRQHTSVPVSTDVGRMVVADFNGDGKSDVAATGGSNSSTVSVLLGDGAGGLSAPNSFGVGSGTSELTAADFNNDGKNDLAVTSHFSSNVSILLGDGAGGFAPAVGVPIGGRGISLAAGDFDADGKRDLVVLSDSFVGVVVLAGLGNGDFEQRASLRAGFSPIAVRIGDFNGDGARDVVIAENRDHVVTIYQGDGAGNFTGPFHTYAGASLISAAVADLNADGKSDLLVTGVTIAALLNTRGVGAPTVQLCPSNYAVGEGVRNFQVVVTRSGDASGQATVAYTTQNNTATDVSDYGTAVGELHFAPGDVSKSFTVFINDDAYAEPVETFLVRLTGVAGANLGQPTSLSVSITDNEKSPGPNPVSPDGFNPSYFVRQHYVDFLNREPDAPGLAFWTNELNSCGADAQCVEVKRVNVSAAFFLSIEFQETGYLAYRTYKAAYGDATSPNVTGTVPVIRFREFLADSQLIGRGVRVNVDDWQQQLEANKQAYTLGFVRRQRFTDAYPATMTAEEFVSRLDQNAGQVLSAGERSQLVASLAPAPSDTQLRAAALRRVAESATLRQRELNRAFVLMEYFGYLRRNPDDAPDSDFRGWRFWLDKLDEFNGNYVQAEMVKAFITSDEYRRRFGQ